MRPKEFDIDMADATLTGFASNATGATFVLTATATTDGLAHQVSIHNDTANDHSAKTIILVGTDADGKAQTETIAGPGASVDVESTLYFLTLTSATPSATIGTDTFDIGWVDEVMSKTIPIDRRSESACSIAIDGTGTLEYTVQETLEMVQGTDIKPQQHVAWHSIATGSGDDVMAATVGATAIRLRVNSYSSGAELQMHISQPGN